MINRLFQVLLIASTIAFSWFAMMATHEFGHIINAWLSGGTVSRVLLHPLAFSRTDLSINPHPLFVAWGGAVWGCLIPLALLMPAHLLSCKYKFLFAWFSGFCCITNGAYLLGGLMFSKKGPSADDAGVILQNGGAPWQLLLFASITIPLGFWLWNGLGPNFGLGSAHGNVDRKAAIGISIALFILILIELLFNYLSS